MNQVALVGNITGDPHLRYTQSGKAVANFTLAVSHRTKANGQWQDVTDGFFTITCWNSLADNVAVSLKKGCRTVVIGKLSQRTSTPRVRSARRWKSWRLTLLPTSPSRPHRSRRR